MLIGAHVSPAGGPAKALERGDERGCRSIQIFNQSPRQWKPHAYSDDQLAEYREALEGSGVESVLIHAVYLLNPASDDPDIREKTLASLTTSLRVGDALGAAGVVLHPGSALKGEVGPAIKRAGDLVREALAESGSCELHLEDTAGAGGTLGRTFEELAKLLRAGGRSKRLGVCLDSCHLLASGYDVRTIEGVDEMLERFDDEVGLEKLRSLHLNDSQQPLGSNRDRHAPVAQGELGEDGCAAFLSAPAFDDLPCILETPGDDDPPGGPAPAQIQLTERLRGRGRTARGLA
jgi:deoxyribonuclease IV